MKTIRILLSAVLLFGVLNKAQSQTDTLALDTTCVQAYVLSDYPVFPGCEDVANEERMMCMNTKATEVIRKHIIYPVEAMELETSGEVTVQFVVEKDGTISNIVALSYSPFQSQKKESCSQEGREALEKESVRVVKQLPSFISPGKNAGKPVRVYLRIPLMFRLN